MPPQRPSPTPSPLPSRGEERAPRPPAPPEDAREELAEPLERWIEAFRGPLVGLLASWGAGWREADELAQDAFAEAWLGRARFRGAFDDLDAVGAWLRGIAFHLWNARLRRERLRAHQPLEQALEQVDHDGREPQAASAADERRAALRAAFAALSAPHQTVLRMHYLEETSAREVAALLGITPKAVEGRLRQARLALRALLERAPAASARGEHR